MSHILVTGAAGFIGSHTVEHLLTAGHTVAGIDNFRTGRKENLDRVWHHPRFHFEKLDISRVVFAEAYINRTRPEIIIHVAALVSVQESIQNPALNFRLNIATTQVVAEAARRYGVKRIVFASSAAAYGHAAKLPVCEDAKKRPISPYGAAKLASESILLGHGGAFGLTVCCLRYFNVYGPRQDPNSPYSGVISIFCSRLRADKFLTIFGDGSQTRDFISVHDVARANVIAATKAQIPSGAYNICTGRAISVSRLAETLGELIPAAPKPRHAKARGGDIQHSCGDPGLAKSKLRFEAQISIEEGLKELIQM